MILLKSEIININTGNWNWANICFEIVRFFILDFLWVETRNLNCKQFSVFFKNWDFFLFIIYLSDSKNHFFNRDGFSQVSIMKIFDISSSARKQLWISGEKLAFVIHKMWKPDLTIKPLVFASLQNKNKI